MSLITEQVKELREEADFIIETLDKQFPTTIGVAKIMKRAADTIEQLAAKVRAENNVSQPCEDAISRQAVEDKLLKLCNELEGIFANIRMQNQDESVCGLCEYDCPAPYECPGFDIEDCFKLADEIRHEWQSTKELPSVNPQYAEDEIQKMQDLEQAEIEKAYELGRAEQPKTGHWIRISPAEIYECSECGQNVMTSDICAYRFCHGCGAKMVESPESEEG